MLEATMVQPRYPGIHVRLRSSNPLALVGAVRHALRRAGVERSEIHRFSDQALTADDPSEQREVCRGWVEVDLDAPPRRWGRIHRV